MLGRQPPANLVKIKTITGEDDDTMATSETITHPKMIELQINYTHEI